MATILSFLSGRQITDANGAVVEDAELFHYQAGTTNDLTVYSNQAGTTPLAQPVPCDAGGFVPLIYVGDSSDWKVVIKDGDGVTLRTYDNLPKAVAEVSAADFAPPLFEWTQVTSASSPVALTAADAGKAYEADTTSGNIEFDLPSAASVGDGKGFLFKKMSSSNTMTLDPNGSETIDNTSTSLAIAARDTVLGIFSNGAEWYTVIGYGLFRIINNLTADAAPDRAADYLVSYDASASVEKKVLVNDLITPGAILVIAEDNKTSGTAADTLTSGSDTVRTLNTLVYNRGTIASIASNRLTLPAGTYEIEWFACIGGSAVDGGTHQSFLYNQSDAAEVKRGTSGEIDETGGQGATLLSTGSTVVTIAASKAFEIRHRTSIAGGTVRQGDASSFGTEVYTRVIVRAA